MMAVLRNKMRMQIDKELFQWEKNRYINFSFQDQNPSYFTFHNPKSRLSLEVLPQSDKVKIPNILLKEALPITAEACIGETGEGQVIDRRTFKVLKRPRPENYIDKEEEIYVIYDGGEEI